MSVVVGQRNVPDTPANQMFYAVDKARALSVYTIRICANPKIFDDKYKDITARHGKRRLKRQDNPREDERVL